MDYLKLGTTGLEISRLCLGCMTYGTPDRGNHAWTLPEDESRPLIKAAVEAGITFFDTANSYSDGTSEEITGRALKEYARREEVVIATKVFFRTRPGPNGAGLSRKAIMTEVDASLRRLGTDYIDLYQIHRFDPDTPLEETLEALHDVVKAGKVRYLGASSMWAWQFAKALFVQDRNGWARFVSMQDHYNLLMREEEREMHPLCADQGVAVIPWSPMARGVLTRPWGESTNRSATDKVLDGLYPHEDSDREIVDAVGSVAQAHGVSRAKVALAWVLAQPAVTAPIVGVGKPSHLDDALGALDLTLTTEELDALEAPYTPRLPGGFR
jgi:1-deoxyxylulose-5-phosphate synthase